MRTTARETLFKILYSSQITGEIEPELKKALYKNEKLDEKDIAYCETALDIIRDNMQEFTEILDKNSLAFPEKRIFPADKSILLLALAEIKGMDDVPEKVSLNEAANIASKYSSEKSASFITGILSSVIGESKK